MSRHMTITTWIALGLLGCVVLLLVVVPLLPAYDPYTQDLGSSLLAPFERLDDGRLSIFGTDKLGHFFLQGLDVISTASFEALRERFLRQVIIVAQLIPHARGREGSVPRQPRRCAGANPPRDRRRQ